MDASPRKRANPYSDEDTLDHKKRKMDQSDETCDICGAKMSVLLIDNHRRHCSNYNKDENTLDTETDEHTATPQSPLSTNSEQEIDDLIQCEYCECHYHSKIIAEHKTYCGSRTDLCSVCGERDTLKNLMQLTHKCNTNTNTNTNQQITNANQQIKNESNINVTRIQMKKLLEDLNYILYHRFEEYDQKKKECGAKYKKILSLLIKILENIRKEPSNETYRTLKCNNRKLKSFIFSYFQCSEFLKLCTFEYMNHMYYKMENVDDDKLRIGLIVLKEAQCSFDGKVKMDNNLQMKWESNQAIEKNKESLFYGSWCCKNCNHLNRKSLKCSKCKKRKAKKPKESAKVLHLSVERWICRFCSNRNAMDFWFCNNCGKNKLD